MLNHILTAATIVVLIILSVLLWQVWYFFKRKDIPDDEPLGEERAGYIKRRLTWISICAGVEVVLQITAAVLRFVEAI